MSLNMDFPSRRAAIGQSQLAFVRTFFLLRSFSSLEPVAAGRIIISSASRADNSTQLSTNSDPAAKKIMSKIMIMIKNDRERLRG